jgi:putative DNA primase/helicase
MNLYTLEDFLPWKLDSETELAPEKISFSAELPKVELERFKLSEKIEGLILEGWQGNSGYRSRSEADQAVVVALLSNGATEDEIRAVFLAHPIGEKYREKGNQGDNYLSASIGNAKRFLEAEARAEKNEEAGDGGDDPGAATAEQPEGAAAIPNPTDLGNAGRFAAMHAGNALYSMKREKWAIWAEGQRWRWDETGRIFDLAAATIKSIYGEAAAQASKRARAELSAHATRSESRARIESMLGLARTLPEIRTELERFDQNLRALGCLRSTVDLSTGKNEPAKKQDFITLSCAAEFDPEARCPRWDQFIDEITVGDKELAAFLQRAVGYSLTGLTTEQCFFILFGTGGNGKSTFVDTILTLMGDYGRQVKTEILLESRYEQKDYHLAELHGARFIAACESNMRRRLATSLLKQASGGDPITGRRPFERPFTFYPRFKLWLSTNSRPRVDDPSDAMWRRIHAIPFSAKFLWRHLAPAGYEGPFIDGDLGEKLKTEFPGILNWAISGCADWRENGLKPPKIVQDATKQYREEEDVFGRFLEERCEIDPKATASATALYESYKNWCEENGEEPEKQNAFGRMMTSRGFSPGKNRQGRVRCGLKLKSS